MIATYISYIRYLAVAFPVILGWAMILDWFAHALRCW
jgi:hypothetical protein